MKLLAEEALIHFELIDTNLCNLQYNYGTDPPHLEWQMAPTEYAEGMKKYRINVIDTK